MGRMKCVRQLQGRRRFAAFVLLAGAWVGGCAAQPAGSGGETWVARRDRAVLRGMNWMETFLARDKNFDDVGLDSVYIFLEIAASSRNAEIRAKALTVARRYATRVAKRLVEAEAPLDNWDLLDLVDLLAEAESLGLDAELLRDRADESLAYYHSFQDFTNVAFNDLAHASEDDVFDSMMGIYSLAKAEAVCGEEYAVEPGLADVLVFIKKRQFVSAADDTSEDKDLFQDHAYLATHVAYILSNYGRLRLRRADAPWLHRYLRANFAAVLADKDIELVAEFIDIFRSLGCGEADDDDVRAGAEFLLATRNDDGSWGPWRDEEDAYDAIHYTWCAISGLRERVFLENTPYEYYIARVLEKLNR